MIWFAVALLLLSSGAVSGSETALFALDRQTLRTFSQSRNVLQRRAHALMRAPHRVLMTVLIANTAINVAIFTMSYVATQPFQEARPTLAAACSAGSLVAVIVLGEIVPKTIALSAARPLAPVAASLIAVLALVLGPVRWLFGTLLVSPLVRLLSPTESSGGAVTTGELRMLVEHSARDGAIDSTEHEMLQAAVAASDVRVREIMTPRVDLLSVPLSVHGAGALRVMRAAGARRVLVRGRSLDDLRGLLYARDLHFRRRVPVRTVLRPLRFVPEQANLFHVLRHFRRTRSTFAIVVDEYGGTAGSVSIEDVAEWILGEVPDDEEVSRPTVAEQLDENTYRVPGNLSARLLADRFALRSLDRHIDTVGGLVLARLGCVPRPGDQVTLRNLTLRVERMRHRRIESIILQRLNGPDAPSPQAVRLESLP